MCWKYVNLGCVLMRNGMIEVPPVFGGKCKDAQSVSSTFHEKTNNKLTAEMEGQRSLPNKLGSTTANLTNNNEHQQRRREQ
jgi:hypothetical protein